MLNQTHPNTYKMPCGWHAEAVNLRAAPAHSIPTVTVTQPSACDSRNWVASVL